MSGITDTKSYLELMDKSMTTDEKLFFINQVNFCKYDYIVDFGCADGTLLHKIASLTEAELIGIDNYFTIAVDERIRMFKDVKSVEKILKNKNYLLICSSILHELPSIDHDFKHLLFGAATVVIRDMYFDTELVDEPHRKEIEVAMKNKVPECYRNFPTDTIAKAYELILKYTYVKNYQHEILEHYFCNNAYTAIKMLLNSGYEAIHLEKYILPYKQFVIFRDFDIKLKYPTHIKAILTKNNI